LSTKSIWKTLILLSEGEQNTTSTLIAIVSSENVRTIQIIASGKHFVIEATGVDSTKYRGDTPTQQTFLREIWAYMHTDEAHLVPLVRMLLEEDRRKALRPKGTRTV